MNFEHPEDVEEALESQQLSVRDLYALWERRLPVPDAAARKSAGAVKSARQIPWLQSSLSLARQYIARALEKEEFLLVCDAARETLRHWTSNYTDEDPTDLVRVRMDYAAALTRLGLTREARRELEPYAAKGTKPPLGRKLRAEILLRLGDILREESRYTPARAAKLQIRTEALGFYRQSLELDCDRVDVLAVAAGVSLVLGAPGSALREDAKEKALRILALAAAEDETIGPRARAIRARATAHAVLGDVEAAAESYRALADAPDADTKVLADARYYSQFIAEALDKPCDFFKPAFPPLQLVVFSGHRPDMPGRGGVRFPPELIQPVRDAIADRLKKLDVRAGLVSAAAGADLLFVEALHAQRGTVHLMLPWSREEFRQTNVLPFESPGGPPVWEPLFEKALEQAATIREIGQPYEPSSEVGWAYATEVMAGAALYAARVSRLDVLPMVLWDGRAAPGTGRGTAAFEAFWRGQLRCAPEVIALPAASEKVPAVSSPRQNQPAGQHSTPQQVKSMLFADIVGYSKLRESAIPEFVGTFLRRVSELVKSTKHAPRYVNTWGDALYAVFDAAHDAGAFALELVRLIQEGRNDWLKAGLFWEDRSTATGEIEKHSLNVRVGLHTGPVFVHQDPVVGQQGFSGAHVNRAARIEPVAQPGEVFASEEFAALAELVSEIRRCGADDAAAGFVCEYAGSMKLPKGYPGRHRIYRLLPHRVFGLDELARAVHEDFCLKAAARGETPETAPALRPWDQLPDDLREANLAQVADIPNKLRRLGYELAPGYGIPPTEIAMTDAQLEELSIREHDRWMSDRIRQGWTYGTPRDNQRKHHPLLVPWDQLEEVEKEKDRDAVRNLPKLIDLARFRLKKVSQAW